MAQLRMFDDVQRRCEFCGIEYVPVSLDMFKIAVKLDTPDLYPDEQVTDAKNGYRLNSRFCSWEHFMLWRARENDRIERELWERYFRKIR